MITVTVLVWDHDKITINNNQLKMSPKFDVDYVLANITEDDKIALLSGIVDSSCRLQHFAKNE
jgi:hypothetical protein